MTGFVLRKRANLYGTHFRCVTPLRSQLRVSLFSPLIVIRGQVGQVCLDQSMTLDCALSGTDSPTESME